MNKIKSYYNILPIQGFPTEKGENLDKEAIAFWASSGFFFESDSFWKEVKWQELDFNNQPWHYKPRSISFDQAVNEFAVLFEQIVSDQVKSKKVILPLSGGLDSRSLAVALKNLGIIPFSFSYRFQDSFMETQYGEEIAQMLDWPFKAYEIPEGYLWNKIEEGGRINKCYAEFTHPRQLAVAEEISKEGDLWLLGHWGDVLFDDMGVADNLLFQEQVQNLKKKVLKKGGIELARDLWKAWGLEASFEQQLDERLERMHQKLPIENANSRIRAFKSLYWANRWTTTNLSFFNNYKPMALPYYDDRMCKFIMGIPEEYLAGRKIQIEYIKRFGGDLAKVPWQDKKPYNLYNYYKHRTLRHLPYRIKDKILRIWKENVMGQKLILRNWENQFVKGKNEVELKSWLFNNTAFEALVPREISEKYYQLFLKDNVYWSHPVSMLLTLSVFCKNYYKGNSSGPEA